MLSEVVELARRAGSAVMEVYSRPFSVKFKEDSTPLTEADSASHLLIAAGLPAIAPGVPVISEEGEGVPFEARRGWKRFWLVDPLDGTKEFIRRNGEFTVNIALIEDGAPVLGVVYAPACGLMYYAERGGGAFRERAGGTPERVCSGLAGTGVRAVVSRSHPDAHVEAFLKGYDVSSRVEAGSSLKFCIVAEGRADLYPRFGETWEWDTAAGHAVAAVAGASVTLPDGSPLFYNKESLRNPGFIAAAAGLHVKPYQAAQISS
ncbi:MAG: 3'(2'),5'-bisphosphate nucleotidase CysQ [Deltaproteobacteria bacterium]|nr:3'(2'),5'-bisphosphate nucleotidase CysQ [Deltaproteobacteria bacterium]MCL4872686.1 3'(2'),5'-bisphosphate nucleotidase CysQ [bacterium]